MSARVQCQACQHQFTIPEPGKRYACPNCQSPYVPEKSGAGAIAPGIPKRPALNKTMLGETDTSIQFSCPHCKKSIEAASIEAGTKKPCPGCGQRVSVPSSSPSGEMQPSSSSPSVSSSSVKSPTPVGSRNLLIGGGIAAAGLVVLVLLACMYFAFSGGGDRQALMKASPLNMDILFVSYW